MKVSRTTSRNALLATLLGAAAAAPVACQPASGPGASPQAFPAQSAAAGSESRAAPPPESSVPLGAPREPGDPGQVDIRVDVRSDGENRPISPLIYGINFDVASTPQQRWTVIRHGGNRLTTYNWENNASNAGSDFGHQNDGHLSNSDEPAAPLLELIDAAGAFSATSIVTISNADYVAADKQADGDVRSSGPDYLVTRFKRNRAKKPTPFETIPNPFDQQVYQDEFVHFLRARRPGARVIFSLDNEPDLWNETHPAIFQKPLTYAELWRRNHEFASATKQAWPGCEVLGFVSYGFLGYWSLQNAPDAAGRNFVEWYLDQARLAEEKAGQRLIDYLDLHWYPEARGADERVVFGSNAPDVAAAREQAPRSLWDPSYQEVSWVRDVMNGPVDLLHWLEAKIDKHYPGTKLAFTEWNFGGANHISGAIATADVLGIFGRYGVDLATYWTLVEDESFAYAAFRLFRNYDGKGSAFGDISLSATTSDAPNSSVYASGASDDPRRTTLVLINKADTPKRMGITIRHPADYKFARVWKLAGSWAEVIPGPTLTAVATNAFQYDMPENSIAVVIPSEAAN